MRKKVNYEHLREICKSGTPSLSAQDALNELCNYFLGEHWYAEPADIIRPNDVNYVIVKTIEEKYRGCKIERRNLHEKYI